MFTFWIPLILFGACVLKYSLKTACCDMRKYLENVPTGLIEQRKCAEPADFLGGSRYEPTTAWLFRPAYSKTFNKDEWPVP